MNFLLNNFIIILYIEIWILLFYIAGFMSILILEIFYGGLILNGFSIFSYYNDILIKGLVFLVSHLLYIGISSSRCTVR
jgi:hypothetical protein